MDGGFSARGADYIGRARALGPAIAAAAAEVDRIRDIPEALFQQLVAQGLFRLLQPQEMGGAELDPPDFIQVLEEIARHDASTAWCVGQNNVCSTVTAYLPPDAARAIFASPRDILAWGPGPQNKARAVPGGYRLSGTFAFASGSRHATWLGANVSVVEADGSPRIWPHGERASYSMIFPRGSVEVHDVWHVLGLKGTGSDSYTLDDLFIPESHAAPRTLALRTIVRPLYCFTPSAIYAPGFACVALGIARATLDAFIAEASDTTSRGAAKSRAENNVVQSTVGQSEARLRSARAFLLGSVQDIWAEVQRTQTLTHDHQVTIRLASTWAIQQARETVTQLYLAAGSMAILENRPFEKRFRDIHTLTQQIQGHVAHFETVGQILMGLKPDRPMFTF